MDYANLVSQLTVIAEEAGVAEFLDPILPAAIEYAQQRIYADIPMLASRSQTTLTNATVAGSRSVNLSLAPVIVLQPEAIALITPSGQTDPTIGTRVQYEPTTLAFIDTMYPTQATTLAPTAVFDRFWALLDDHTVVLGPTPGAGYTVEVTGLFRPASISATNTTTYLSLTYPELLVAGCMVYITGYQRNWGAQADDPKMALSWEGQYQTLARNCHDEELRRRNAGTGWDQDAPTPLAPNLKAES